jgi:signal transduction histidine kinase
LNDIGNALRVIATPNLSQYGLSIFAITFLVSDIWQLIKEKSAILREKAIEAAELSAQKITTQAVLDQRSQIAHDIRSPLFALNMIANSLLEVPEEKRLIIRSATQRISDNANDLLQRNKIEGTDTGERSRSTIKAPALEAVMLSALLDSIVSEKRVEYRNLQGIDLDSHLQQGYGLFVLARQDELARVMSNMINNSIEAISDNGSVLVNLYSDNVYPHLPKQKIPDLKLLSPM